MSKITLTDLVNLENQNTAVNAINTNNAVLEAAFNNTISRDGTAPNQMQASLDMNSNEILNLPTPTSNYEPIRLIDVATINAGGITVSPLPTGGTTNQILGKVTNTNYDVSWRDNHPVIAGGATGQVLAKSSGTDYALTWANGSTVSSGDGIDITPGSPSIINLRDYKSIKDYGAVGDGITDDAPALRAAIADMVSGEVLYIPPANPGYYINSVVSGAVVTLDNRSISIWGGGWQLKNEGTYANVRGSVFIVGPSIGDSDDIFHWKGTDVVFGASFKNFAVCGLSNAYGGDHGRNIFFIDAPTLTGDDFYLSSFSMDNCFFCNGKTGYSFKVSADLSTNNGGGGLSWSTISNSDMMNMRLEGIGDSVTIRGCTLGANALVNSRNTGIYLTNNQGVTSTRIVDNVFNNFSGSIVIDKAISPVITGNEFELNDPQINLHGSMIDLDGQVTQIVGAYIAGNTISQNSSVASYIPLRINNALGTYVIGNRIAARTGNHIEVTVGAQNTFIGHGIYFSGASVVNSILLLGDAGFFTSDQSVGGLRLCGDTSGKTLLRTSAVASGTVTLPAATDTLVGKATTDTFTNKTFDTAGTGNSFSINGLAATANTGTGSVVRATSPTLVTPALGTPSALVGTNITGTAAGLTAGNVTTNANLTGAVTSVGNATSLGSFSSANLATALTDETGSGANVFATSPTLVTPALGTPSSGVATNLTGTASGLTAGNVTTNANLTGAITSVGNATSLGSFTSANLATALTDETGSGANVFANTPTLVTPVLGAATGTSLNLSGLTASAAVATDSSKNLVSVTNTGTGNNVLAASPTLSGTPLSTTAAADTNTTQIATTAYVLGQSATQANQETSTSTTTYVSPGRQQYHPSAAKFWALVTVSGGVGTLVTGFNVASVNVGSTGHLTVTYTTAFSSANYAVFSICDGGATSTNYSNVSSKVAGSCVVTSLSNTGVGGTFADPNFYCIMGFGDQ